MNVRAIVGLTMVACWAGMPAVSFAQSPGWGVGTNWVRQSNFQGGTAQGATSANEPNAGVWHYEWIGGGDALGGADPWYDNARTTRIWDTAYYSNPGAWVSADNMGPTGRAVADTYLKTTTPRFPVVRWQSPGDGTIAVERRYSFKNTYASGGSVDYAVLHLAADGSVKAVLSSGPVTLSGGNTSDVVLDHDVDIERDESILFTMRPQDPSLANFEMMRQPSTSKDADRVKITVTAVRQPTGTVVSIR